MPVHYVVPVEKRKEIRRLFKTGEYTVYRLSKMFYCEGQTIKKILKEKDQ